VTSVQCWSVGALERSHLGHSLRVRRILASTLNRPRHPQNRLHKNRKQQPRSKQNVPQAHAPVAQARLLDTTHAQQLATMSGWTASNTGNMSTGERLRESVPGAHHTAPAQGTTGACCVAAANATQLRVAACSPAPACIHARAHPTTPPMYVCMRVACTHTHTQAMAQWRASRATSRVRCAAMDVFDARAWGLVSR
jgi:hypothetical protein